MLDPSGAQITMPTAPAQSGRAAKEANEMARRRYQTGSLLIRGTRRKVYVLRYYEPVLLADGKVGCSRKSVVLGLVGEIGSKKQARVIADTILRRVNSGQLRPQSAIPFERFVRERWIPTEMPLLDPTTLKMSRDGTALLGSKARPGSAETYGSKLRSHLIPAFGGKQLNEITRWDIQSFLTEKLRQGNSAAHVHGMRTTMSKVLQAAVAWGLIGENPARGCHVARQEARRERRFLNSEQVQRLATALPEPCRSVVLVAVLTGLRIGEILALRWGRVDFLRGTVAVEETYSGRFGPPKTRSSRRTIPMSSGLRQVLEIQRGQCGGIEAAELVFSTSKGTPLSQKNLRNRVLEPTRQALGLPPISWHTFRYTHATWLSEAQVSARVAQSILGHADVSMTLNVYTQVVEESQRLAVEKIAAVLDPNGPKLVNAPHGGNSMVN
jgi:integrase